MPPPKELRRRLEQQRTGEQDGASNVRSPAKRSYRWIAAVVLVIGAACMYARPQPRRAAPPPEEIKNPEVLKLLDLANKAIRVKYNYTLALGYIEQAKKLDEKSMDIKQFYAAVLLALDRVQDAWHYSREVFLSGSASSQDMHFLQQYVLTLHRLDKHEELAAAWPQIASTPGVHWRTPMQCPDMVDEVFLADAVPFPRPEELRVGQLMQEHSAAILKEFNDFRVQPGWKSFFKPNQDNDLVEGNEGQKWAEMLLFDRGAWDPRYCAIFKTVCRIFGGLRDIEGIFNGKRSGQVSLLKLEPGTTLVPHFGSVNWRYVAHLTLATPDNVIMTAGKETRQFKEGEVVILDDSFLHSVSHQGASPRVTLFASFFHPKAKPMTPEEWYARDT